MDGPELGSGSPDPYHPAYFATLYRGGARNGRCGQTWADRGRDRLAARLVERFAPNGRVRPALLDVGCGYGYLLDRLRGRFELHGIDVSKHAVEESRRRLGDAAIARADVQEGIPFTGPFEVVLAVNVLEHLAQPAAAVRNIRNALTHGGVAIVHLPTIDNAVSRMIYGLSYASDPTHVYRPSADAVRELFASLGLALAWESQWPHVPRRLWNAVRWHPAYLAVYRRG